LLKNLAGNWLVSGTYTFETPEYATVQSGVDSNLNGDTAGDRAIINPSGIANVGSDAYAVARNGNQVATGSAATVAYIAVNPNARCIEAQLGALTNSGRNTLATNGINNFDISLTKKFNLTESKHFELGGQFYNILNHPQATPGSLNDVTPALTSVTTASRNFLQPSTPSSMTLELSSRATPEPSRSSGALSSKRAFRINLLSQGDGGAPTPCVFVPCFHRNGRLTTRISARESWHDHFAWSPAFQGS
jgi:hypothetical protein